ncbi:unnamed protein product [Arabis nemorensis]|uniref:Uncharacterized protein n=1 Tax=Arabis nemorensis TaxID=586526 RepID=A0A565CRS8_9BRAS|nr:unnamed protein product [Arabis nemorensis]
MTSNSPRIQSLSHPSLQLLKKSEFGKKKNTFGNGEGNYEQSYDQETNSGNGYGQHREPTTIAAMGNTRELTTSMAMDNTGELSTAAMDNTNELTTVAMAMCIFQSKWMILNI